MSVNKYDPQTKQLIPIAGQAAPVKADGVTFPSRAAVNFVDHTVRDNPENDETDILPYELTDEDMENIMENPPVNPTSMPILFDETGAERVVGWYVTSAGKKPVYEKNYDITISSGNKWSETPTNVSGFEKVVSMIGIVKASNGVCYSSGGNVASRDSVFFANKDNVGVYPEGTNYLSATVILRYTKTTDTPS